MFFSDDDAEEDFSVNCTDFDELLDDNKPELIVISRAVSRAQFI